MAESKIPESLADKVAWVIAAPSSEALRQRYDLWAQAYDGDIGTVEDYLAPLETAKVAKRYLAPDARILDAGAGTGLSGEALRAEGFENLTAVDFSAGMLKVAEQKGIYRAVVQADLGRQTEFPADCFDGVFTTGTTSQMPCESLTEFARVVRPGGHIVFSVWPEAYADRGYAAVQESLEAAGRLSVIHKGAGVQVLPTSEPDMYCQVWVFQVLR